MATVISSSGTVPPRLTKGVSHLVELNSFASVRRFPAATFSSCSTSRGLGLLAPLIAEAREPSGREAVNFWLPNKAKQITRRAASRQQTEWPETVPLWLWICQALYRGVKDAFQFLWEQPGQLKAIEWPSFQSTIRMAVLTVVVVALLIIILATIDSTFSYALSSVLRRVP